MKKRLCKIYVRYYCLVIFIIVLYIINGEALESTSNIAKISIDDTYLTAFDNKGNPVWVKNLENSINFRDLADLDGDGNNEIVIATCNEGDQSGSLYVFSSSGEKLWDYNFSIIENVYKGLSNRFLIYDLIIKNLWNNGTKSIIISLRNSPYYATELILFDTRGNIIGNYWHPGNIFDIEVLDVDNDGHKEIIGGGVNNDWEAYKSNYRPVIFVLDPANMNGQAPPFLGSAPKAKEKQYIILPQSTILKKSCPVMQIWTENNLTVASLEDGRIFYFNSSMKNVKLLNGLSFTETEANIRGDPETILTIEYIIL